MKDEEKNILVEALNYFNLGLDFTEEELKKAYHDHINVIHVDFKAKEINYTEYDRIYEYYVALYKMSKIMFIEKTLLSDVKLDNIEKEGKTKIKNISQSCVKFYEQNNIYRSIVNTLLDNIKANYKLFCEVDIENAKTIEEVDNYFNKFVEENLSDFKKFALDIMTASEEISLYRLPADTDTIVLDFSKINSVKELLVKVKDIVVEMLEKASDKISEKKSDETPEKAFDKISEETIDRTSNEVTISNEDKKKMISLFIDKVVKHFPVNSNVPEKEKEINKKVQKKAGEFYYLMFKEKDYDKFFEIYKDAVEYIDTQIPKDLRRHRS